MTCHQMAIRLGRHAPTSPLSACSSHAAACSTPTPPRGVGRVADLVSALVSASWEEWRWRRTTRDAGRRSGWTHQTLPEGEQPSRHVPDAPRRRVGARPAPLLLLLAVLLARGDDGRDYVAGAGGGGRTSYDGFVAFQSVFGTAGTQRRTRRSGGAWRRGTCPCFAPARLGLPASRS